MIFQIALFLLIPFFAHPFQDQIFEEQDLSLYHQVKVITGHFQYSACDHILSGPVPLPLMRTYTSAGALYRTKKDTDLFRHQMVGLWTLGGGWNFFPHLHLNVHLSIDRYNTKAHLTEPSGVSYDYLYDHPENKSVYILKSETTKNFLRFDEEFLKQVAQKQKESLNGEYVEYWPNGELKVRAYWKNAKIDGHLHGWYPNCLEAFKGYFSEGVRQGVHMVFLPLELRIFASDDIRCYYYNEKGQLHGDQTVLYPGGGLKACASYKNGVLDGEVLLFDINEKKTKEWKYKKGKLITKPKKSSA